MWTVLEIHIFPQIHLFSFCHWANFFPSHIVFTVSLLLGWTASVCFLFSLEHQSFVSGPVLISSGLRLIMPEEVSYFHSRLCWGWQGGEYIQDEFDLIRHAVTSNWRWDGPNWSRYAEPLLQKMCFHRLYFNIFMNIYTLYIEIFTICFFYLSLDFFPFSDFSL